MRNAFINQIIEIAQKRKDLFIVSGDAGLGVFDEFKQRHPDKFLNLGVAEQNAISFSAGMALVGFKVYIYNIVPFVLYRCYEQVRNDICYQKLGVVMVGIGSGVTYAPQGMTHYSVEDIGLAQTLPNLEVFSPIDPVEAEAVAVYSLTAENPVYVRLAKRGEPRLHKQKEIDVSVPQLIEDGERVAIVFHGSVAPEAVKARDILKKKKIVPRLISVPQLQPLATKRLFAMLQDINLVICVEEHFLNCGLGSIISREREKLQPCWKLHLLGIPYQFIHEIKDTQGMRLHFGISAEKIADVIYNNLKR